MALVTAGGTAADSNAAAVALLAASEENTQDAWTQLQGISEVLEVMEAAVSQNIHLPQLLLYRWGPHVRQLCWSRSHGSRLQACWLLSCVSGNKVATCFIDCWLWRRDIKLPPPLVVSFESGMGAADGLSAVPSSLTGAGSGQLNLGSPGPPSRPSLCSTPGSSRPTGMP